MKLTKQQIRFIVARLPTLKYGSKGYFVRELQRLLNKVGYALKVDGIFGVRTRAAVKDFQRQNLLVVDGIVGIRTWTKLIEKAQDFPLIESQLPEKQQSKQLPDVLNKKIEDKTNKTIELIKTISPFLIIGGVLLLILKK